MQRKRQRVPGHHLVTAFEATNDTRKEIYLGTTSLLLSNLMKEHAETPPSAIAHWDRADRIRYRSIDYSMIKRDAASFLASYAKSRRIAGWKVLR